MSGNKRRVVSRSTSVDPEKAAQAAKRLRELGAQPGTRIVETGRTDSVHTGTRFASWTCTSCGTKNYSPEAKVMLCQSCSNPKGQDETYEEAPRGASAATTRQLDESHISADHASDATCPFCGADVYHDVKICPQCGGNIEDGIPPQPVFRRVAEGESPAASLPKLDHRLIIGVVGAIMALCLGFGGLFLFLRPQTDNMYVQSVSWTRTINVEEYQYVAHEGFDNPPGDAESIQVEDRISGYQNVLDHYETQVVEKSREVFDHNETRYRTEYQTVSDGYVDQCHTESVYDHTESVYDHTEYTTYDDGTTDSDEIYRDVAVYKDKEVCVKVEQTHQESVQVPYEEPVYRTEYYTEEVQVPIYRQDPIYNTYYWWSHWEWVGVAPVVASGSDNSPYWPDPGVGEGRRESGRSETMTVVFAWAEGEKVEQVFDEYHPADVVEFAKYEPGSVWSIRHSAAGFEVLEEVAK